MSNNLNPGIYKEPTRPLLSKRITSVNVVCGRGMFMAYQ